MVNGYFNLKAKGCQTYYLWQNHKRNVKWVHGHGAFAQWGLFMNRTDLAAKESTAAEPQEFNHG